MITDAHAGLAKTVRRQLPEVTHQRGTVHLTRNVLDKTPWQLRACVAEELRRATPSPSPVRPQPVSITQHREQVPLRRPFHFYTQIGT